MLSFLLLVLVPLLPVNQVQSSLDWPQNNSIQAVNAPLISLAPQEVEITVPVAAVDHLRPGESVILGTLPESSQEAFDRGLFITAPGGGLVVSSLNEVVFELTPAEVQALPDDAKLELHQTHEAMTVRIPGTSHKEEAEDDYRAQFTGFYTELDPASEQLLIDAGLAAHIDINSRFTSTPSAVKMFAMIAGLISALAGLWALGRLDSLNRRSIPFFGEQWRTFRPLDALVVAVLLFWHVFGANTSDDGFLLTMARVANDSDYMANYYRWYGVPEAPFGSPFYDTLALLAKVSTASMWMRLPTLIAGLLTWWILSREILPKLGEVVAKRRVAYWTAAFVFLAFWLPYNNGTRPEPIIACGIVVTWALFERAIATDRLLPAAVGTITAALTLACGPTGLSAVGVFLVCLPAVFRTLRRKKAIAPATAFIAPFLGAGMAVMVPVFKDQTLAAVIEATSVRAEVGPALNWYDEWVRYATLFEQTVDASMERRFPVFVLIFSLVLILAGFAKHKTIPGTSSGPTKRMVIILALSMFFLMFTPTKWTHHFGIYAGLGGAVAALGAVVLSQFALQSKRNRTFAIAAALFLMSLTLAGWNGWWYVSSFGVPWWDRTVQYKAVEANTIMLALTLVVLLIGIFQSLSHNAGRAEAAQLGAADEFDAQARVDAGRWSGVMGAPIAVLAVLMVAFSCLTFIKAFVSQAPAYSVGMGNVRTFKGDSCALASDVMLEQDTNDSFLTPVGGVPLGRSLDAGENTGFTPDGVPAYIASENANTTDVITSAQTDAQAAEQPENETADEAQSTSRVNTQGNRPSSMRGVNGSTVRLPFNLDYQRIPVAGTFEDDPTHKATLETVWFELPEANPDAPLLVASVAGRIAHHDINGVEQEGTDLALEYGQLLADGTVTSLGEREMLDPGPTGQWRNVNVPVADLPEKANVVRLVAEDASFSERDWLAVTPLRNPTLKPMTEVIDSDTPGLLDWTVAFQYPCQRTFNHYAGVTEIPQFRIMPDAPGKQQLSGFQDFLGGGALATAEAVNYSYDVPGYLRNDWQRDWGSIAKYELRTDSTGAAPVEADVDYTTVSRWGWWTPGPMKIRNPNE
ncbi:arabinosyltransferase domain-containing protein [Corynebacterium sp. Marseille-Q4381]|uniref:arabinosyltransferase domain-containing protein n=1 Tax=Corynebacterium sp. Marseille-Q4381 TaxID=3121597 RepID=UPI003FA526C8